MLNLVGGISRWVILGLILLPITGMVMSRKISLLPSSENTEPLNPVNPYRIEIIMANKINRSVVIDLQDLLKKYSFSRIDTKYPRSKVLPCPELNEKDHAKSVRKEECICDSGVYRARIVWVNSKHAWTTRVGDATVLLMDFSSLFSFTDWFSVDVFPGLKGELPIDKKDLSTPRTDLNACTANWNGEMAGSGIRRFPDSIKGFMYRGPVEGCGDAHFLPETDIVSHLTSLKRN